VRPLPLPAPVDPVSSFKALYAENFRLVWRVLCRMGVQPGTLEDAAQEVFITAYRRLPEFEGRSSLRTWLIGIALRVASETRRRKQRGYDELSAELVDERPDPFRAAAAHESMEHLERLLEGLDEEKREVFVLAEIEQWTMPEISEALGVNLNTAYTRLRAARLAFNRCVEKRGSHE
jgi:RNA polymerase sigma-70 factor (ECF subfamily)